VNGMQIVPRRAKSRPLEWPVTRQPRPHAALERVGRCLSMRGPYCGQRGRGHGFFFLWRPVLRCFTRLVPAGCYWPTGGTVQAQLLSPENTTLKPGVRFTFGTDADMLAADTVVRYGADSSASRVQDQKKAALNPRAYK
jgi:hypothetical protein